MSKQYNGKNIKTFITTLLLLAATNAIGGELVNTGPSFQGYSGLLNTPNAALVPHGSISLQYSDLVFHNNEYTHNNNLTTAIGILPFVEIGGRIAWFDTQNNCYSDGCRLRDLSANVKITMPFIPRELFSLAIGQRDIGGEANHFDTRFLVASKELNKIRLSLGWGQQIKKQTFDRLDGLFGGIEYQPLPWLSAIIEHDGESINVGARLRSPEKLLPFDARLSTLLLLHQESDSLPQKQFFGLSIHFPLASKNNYQSKHMTRNQNRFHDIGSRTEKANQPTQITDAVNNALVAASPSNDQPKESEHQTSLKQLFIQLNQEGFERISVGEISSDTKELAIALENTVYSINDTDAIARVLNIASNADYQQYRFITIVLKKQGIRAFWIRTELNPQPGDLSRRQKVGSGYPSTLSEIDWKYTDTSYKHLKPRLTVSPALSSAVATEFGVWDYSLALEAGTTISLWKGAIASANYTQSLSQSDDFKEDHIFYDNRQLSSIKSYGIQQIVKVNDRLYSSLFAGLSAYDYRSLVNESAYLSKSGQHKLSIQAGIYDNIYETNISRKSYLASYRYYLPHSDLSSSITWGKFWEEDQGLRIDLKFWFGDTAVNLFYKDTDNTFVGMGISLPLTPKRVFNHPWAQIKGANSWQYALQTKIRNPSNDLSFRSAVLPPLPLKLDSTLFNEDRLNPLYIRRNADRLFEPLPTQKH